MFLLLMSLAAPADTWDELPVVSTRTELAAAGHLDDDAFLDLVAVQGSHVVVYANDGFGRFAEAARLTRSGVTWVALADVDGDLDGDVVYVAGNSVYLWRQEAASWAAPQLLHAASEPPARPKVADLDDDDDVDIVFGLVAGEQVAWLENDGLGSFPTLASLGGLGPVFSVDVADVDGDDRTDLLIGGANQFLIAVDVGGATFPVVQSTPTVTDAVDVRAADVDGDGLPDVVSTGASARLMHAPVALGVLGAAVAQTTWYPDSRLEIADIDDDGRDDAVVTAQGIQLTYRSLGASFAGWSNVVPGTGDARDAFAADIDQDGDTDLLYAHAFRLTWLDNPSIAGDLDGDGTPNHEDCDPADPLGTLDSDGDGVCDYLDLCFGDDALGDANLDGWCDVQLELGGVFAGSGSSAEISSAPPGARVTLIVSARPLVPERCYVGTDACTTLDRPVILASGVADANGTFTATFDVPQHLYLQTVHFQAFWRAGGQGHSTAVDSVLVF